MCRDLLRDLGTHLDFDLVGRHADDERDGFTVHVGGLVEAADLGEGSWVLIALHDPPTGRPVSGCCVPGHFIHHLMPRAGDSCLKISTASSSGIFIVAWRGGRDSPATHTGVPGELVHLKT
jgi:hypothetical protein